MLALYADAGGGSAVGERLRAAGLSENQTKEVFAALNGALTDAFYTVLLALDGSAALGGQQQTFQLADQHGTPIASGDGRLESAAWVALQQDQD
ncbi:hypothetical protein KC8_19440 [Sphingomonas sp. KC8]|nr:hypothetical protein KC8_19440 [Sphingomonas sp. KC8]